jgi:hypothetical protein
MNTTNILLSVVIFLQIANIISVYFKKPSNIDFLTKDFILLGKDFEIMRNQMVLIITKSNLDANRISNLESVASSIIKYKNKTTNFH